MKYLVLDIETQSWDPDKFLCGVVIRNDQPEKPYIFHNPKSMYNFILKCGQMMANRNKNLIVYAHNHEFDWYRYKGHLDKRAIITKLTPFLVKIQLEPFSKKGYGGNLLLFDTINIMRGSLDSIGKLLGYEKLEMPEELKSDKPIHPILLSQVQEYCIRDTKILYHLIEKVHECMYKLGIKTRRICTIGQISANHFIHTLHTSGKYDNFFLKYGQYDIPGFIPPTWEAERIILKGYRYGRLQVFNTGEYCNVTDIDLNSEYTHEANNMDIPDISTETLVKEPPEQILDNIGISTCLIKCPKNIDIAVLPVRVKIKGKTEPEIFYPEKAKYIYGTWSNIELKYAKQYGYRVLYIKESVVYRKNKENPFKTVTEKIYEERKKYEKGSFEDKFYKNLLNNLYGKLAQRIRPTVYRFDTITKTNQYEKKGYSISNRIGYDNVYKKEGERIVKKRFYVPILPALVNANARITIHKHISKIGSKDLLYCDTDGFCFTNEHLHTEKFKYSNNLGDFKIVHKGQNALIYHKKAYSIGNHIVLSGISKIFVNKQDFLQGKTKYKKQTSLLNAKDIKDVGVFKDYEADHKKKQEEMTQTYEDINKKDIIIDQAEIESNTDVDTIIKLITKNANNNISFESVSVSIDSGIR